MGRIVVPGQLGKKVHETPSEQRKAGRGGMHLLSQQWQQALNRIIFQTGLDKK
jgi:hypothetical protein